MSPMYVVTGQVTLLLVLGFILIRAARWTVSAVEALVNHSGGRKFGLVVFLVALSTSFPELVMAVVASSNGQGELALANIVGSNIANISIILGGAAVLSGSLKASDEMIKKEITSGFLIGCLPLLLLMDGVLTRIEGLALILVYGIYIGRELRKQQTTSLPPPKAEVQIKHLLHRLEKRSLEKKIGLLIGGVVVMVVAAQGVVMVATALAGFTKISSFLIGLFLLSVGASLPELMFEIVAIRQRQSTMAFGNIIGSIVANGTLILGLAALIQPIILAKNMRAYLISNLAFILIFGCFWLFTKSKHRLDRWEGLMLVLLFGMFGVIQFLVR